MNPKKMNDTILQEFYSDYLDGLLGEADRRRFEKILREHPPRQADYDRFVRTRDLLADLPAEQAEAGFEQRVLRRLRENPAGAFRSWFGAPIQIWKPVALAATLTILIFSVVVMNSRTGDTPSSIAGAGAGGQPGIDLAVSTRPRPQLPPSLQRDPVVSSSINEISSLVEEIQRLQERYAGGGDEILLGRASGQDLVFRPDEFFRRALEAQRRNRGKDDASLQFANEPL